VHDLVFLAPAHLRQAEILQSRGEHLAALEHRRRAVRLWGDADPAGEEGGGAGAVPTFQRPGRALKRRRVSRGRSAA